MELRYFVGERLMREPEEETALSLVCLPVTSVIVIGSVSGRESEKVILDARGEAVTARLFRD